MKQLGQRQVSRSRIGDIFRSVWPGHGHASPDLAAAAPRSVRSGHSRASTVKGSAPPSTLPSHNGRAPPSAGPPAGLSVDALGAASSVGPYSAPDVPSSAPLPARTTAAEQQRRQIVHSPSRPVSPLRQRGDANGCGVELDDVDLDLELSDDDDDEEVLGNGQRNVLLGRGSYMRNDGNGWVQHDGSRPSASSQAQHSSSTSASMPSSPSRSIRSLTPSVEGGYNLFKPPYTGRSDSFTPSVTPSPLGEDGSTSGSGSSESHAAYADLQAQHVSNVLAHRRGSIAAEDLRTSAILRTPIMSPTGLHDETQASVDSGGGSDGRFSDADESLAATTIASLSLANQDDDDGDEEDGAGFVFRARKKN